MTHHRAPRTATIGTAAAVALSLAASLAACTSDPVPPTVNRPLLTAPDFQSVSFGIEDIVHPDQDWDVVEQRLTDAHVNGVTLAAGRVEWTSFDWPAHPEVAAESGRDHLARAIDQLARAEDGEQRFVDILIDALAPGWIAQDPAIGGVRTDGTRSIHQPSASAVHDGPLGDRLLELLEEIARRYEPDQITFTELQFDDETFGDADAALYREMTGARDWPRLEDGTIDEDAPEIGAWRTQVLADFLDRASDILDEVAEETGKRPALATDVRINWRHPSWGRPDAGHDHNVLAQHVDRIIFWAFVGLSLPHRRPEEVERVTAALARSDIPLDDVTISVGLWRKVPGEVKRPAIKEQATISPEEMAEALRAARTHGVTAVNVTPYVLMTDEHWAALDEVWTRLPPTHPSSTPVPSGTASPGTSSVTTSPAPAG